MLPHPIRFRGGWTRVTPQGDVPFVLPTIWPGDAWGICRLNRSFQWPAIDSNSEQLFLLGHNLVGLCQVTIDGRSLDFASEGSIVIPLTRPTAGRGLLSLQVNPTTIPAGLSWGQVALVVASRQATAGDIAGLEL